MSYPLFEILALSVGSVSILLAVIATVVSTGHVGVETVAQLLLLVVLVGAVRRGRRGGTSAAMLAIAAYICMRVPLAVRHGLEPDTIVLVLVRVSSYAGIGIGGGTVCGRIRQLLARLDGRSNIDPDTRLYSEEFIARTVRGLLLQYRRRRKPFSVVFVTLGGGSAADPDAQHRLVRAVAKYIRKGVRLTDDVARLDDGRFMLVLPHTEKSGATSAWTRISYGLRSLLEPADGSSSAEILGVVEDLEAIVEWSGGSEPADRDTDTARAA